MTEKVSCPYCGAGMTYWPYETAMKKWGVYRCEKCMAYAPHGSEADNEHDARESAIKAALRRAEPENRVLTLEEVSATINAPVWLEFKKAHVNDGWALRCKNDFDRTPFFFHADCAEKMEYREGKYGVSWRCWLRKPTDEKRKAVEWDD